MQKPSASDETQPRFTEVTIRIETVKISQLVAIEAVCYEEAEQSLRAEPERAAHLALAANLVADLRVAAMAEVRERENAAGTRKARRPPAPPAARTDKPAQNTPPELPGKRTKHVRGTNGMCSVDHGDGKPCGYVFKRRPRAGSSAATAAAAAEKTEPLFPDHEPSALGSPEDAAHDEPEADGEG